MTYTICAVQPGVSIARYAQRLARAHEAVLSDDQPEVRLRPLVARSWRRMRAAGVDPDSVIPNGKLPLAELERRRLTTALNRVLPELRASLTSVAEDARHIMAISDPYGVVLWREGAARVCHLADGLGFTEGADWSEPVAGTNAIGTAIAEDAPVQIFSAEHYVRANHVLTCTACPVHDPRTGRLLGVIDVTGPAETVHPTTVALVCTAAKLAEASLWRQHQARLEALRAVGAPLLAACAGPGLVVDEHGWVAAVAGMPPVDRVAAPQASTPIGVRGLGPCVAEAVPGGWLLRAADRVVSSRSRLTLELRATGMRAVVESTRVCVHPLSTRHAELLLLLANAGPTGMDAATLSEALYGDREHVVTVRAEMSRMRRTMGGLLRARPYRLSPDVEIATPEFDAGGVLRNSTAPGIQGYLARAARGDELGDEVLGEHGGVPASGVEAEVAERGGGDVQREPGADEFGGEQAPEVMRGEPHRLAVSVKPAQAAAALSRARTAKMEMTS